MKRSPMASKTPLRSAKPMARGAARMHAKKPASAKPKRSARENEDRDLMELCRGQDCFLEIPGICNHNHETVVPAHSNQSIHGKGSGLKAHNRYTVPGCHACHVEIDQGQRFTKAEKFAIWDSAYARWQQDIENLLIANNR